MTDSLTHINIGDTLEVMELASTGGSINTADWRGKKVVLFFYPKDNTPGCTQESKDFTCLNSAFEEENTLVFGISRDKMTSHERFKAKYEMPFELISDPDEVLCELFNVKHQKSMFGRLVFGIVRSTFLIDEEGVLRKEWRKVKVAGHAEEVLEAVKSL